MTEASIEAVLANFRSRVRVSNPNFTAHSLRRTVEVCINDTLNLGFMNTVSSETIDMILDNIDDDEITVRGTK